MSEIEERIKQILVDKLGVQESEVTPEATFSQDLGADSLDTVELIMEFEKQFDIKIPDSNAEKIVTVGDAIRFIEEAMLSEYSSSSDSSVANNHFEMLPFIRHENELTYEELSVVKRDGASVTNISFPPETMIIEALKIVGTAPGNLFTTAYVCHLPGKLYLHYSFDEMLEGFLKQIVRDGKIFFVSELKQSYPSICKLLYNSIQYAKNYNNSEKGVCYLDGGLNKVNFMKSWNIGSKQLGLLETFQMVIPYITFGLKCVAEVIQRPVLNSYIKEQEMKNESKVEHYALSIITKTALNMIFG